MRKELVALYGPAGTMVWVWIVHILCLIRLYHCVSSSDCNNETEYYSNGKCCFKCGPGSYMAADCKEAKYSSCHPCLHGFYQDAWTREGHCRAHSSCPEGDFERIEDGNLFQNVKCLCVKGKHCANKDCEICITDTSCLPGSGVTTLADRRNLDSVCEKCPAGHYSNVTSSTEPCKQWLNCSAMGLVENIPGSSVADAKCRDPSQGGAEYRAAVGVLAVVAVSLLVLLILSQLGYLGKGVQAIWSQCLTKPQPEDREQENGVQESCLITCDESTDPVQEVGKDSHCSEEEHLPTTCYPVER
ncbi:tumor necrosis factor receptor superfamily member 5 [Callorhinchus milii]|uniref:tumor necrosis factor receptor superfamily member 5 n=1 Tax=Callorhinchus milii TaxID=7868 RepID=UPI0004571718|nr:tumor necrosis factor receptor superfamily member 5 [Callorhinchus milii]|eukprot:gi/632939565/ref/XP_007910550.1/ PREDICTED: tumor necrosis factor receptor superfamily member 5-like [Callorhinchus milii]